MDKRKVVCAVASGAAFVLWPPLAVVLVLGAIVAFVTFLDWLGRVIPAVKIVGKTGTVILVIAVLILAWIIWGLMAAEWVKKRCNAHSADASIPK